MAGVTVILIFLAIVCLVSYSIPILMSNMCSDLTVSQFAGSSAVSSHTGTAIYLTSFLLGRTGVLL